MSCRPLMRPKTESSTAVRVREMTEPMTKAPPAIASEKSRKIVYSTPPSTVWKR